MGREGQTGVGAQQSTIKAYGTGVCSEHFRCVTYNDIDIPFDDADKTSKCWQILY